MDPPLTTLSASFDLALQELLLRVLGHCPEEGVIASLVVPGSQVSHLPEERIVDAGSVFQQVVLIRGRTVDPWSNGRTVGDSGGKGVVLSLPSGWKRSVPPPGLILPTNRQNLKGLPLNRLNLPIHNLSTLSKVDALNDQDVVGRIAVDVRKIELGDPKGKPWCESRFARGDLATTTPVLHKALASGVEATVGFRWVGPLRKTVRR